MEITDDEEIGNVMVQNNQVNISKVVRRVRKDGYQNKKSLNDVSTIMATPIQDFNAVSSFPEEIIKTKHALLTPGK